MSKFNPGDLVKIKAVDFGVPCYSKSFKMKFFSCQDQNYYCSVVKSVKNKSSPHNIYYLVIFLSKNNKDIFIINTNLLEKK